MSDSQSSSSSVGGSGLRALKDQLLVLAQVQELDLKIDQLKAQKNALPVNLQTLDGQLEALKKSLLLKTNEAIEIEKGQKQTQAAMDLNKERMDRASKKLEAVSNGQEFQAANKEIEQLKKLNVTLEAQQTKLAADFETNKKVAADFQGKIDVLQKERDEKAAALNGEAAKLDSDLSVILTQRKSFTVQIENTTMSRYDRVRPARAGVGIAAAVSGRCTGCNMVIMHQMYNELQKGKEVHTCPTCSRILFIPTSS